MEYANDINKEYVQAVIKKRPRDVHKGDCGKVLVIAGSKGMAGAAVLCARGALRAGAGLVQVSVPEELYPIIQVAVPEATCILRDYSSWDFGLESRDAVALGPGLGDDPESAKLTDYLLAVFKGTIVLDADGINAISRYGLHSALHSSDSKTILTPHYGEAARLLKHCGIENIKSLDRPTIAKLVAKQTGSICVLKGAGTIVAEQTGNTGTWKEAGAKVQELKGDFFVNTTGNPGMATGGSGDVLTGIIAALAGQGLMPLDAAKAGVFIHGLAGDLCAEALGERGMTSLDIAEKTALAIKKVMGK